uniref:U-box domain containing 5 n=1 Tax=Sander lucioperca TaxID=283035 RepID=A0A8D0DEA9_SANLU
MVVNLCLPHFYATVHCNKLCADGYDVTNLVSADPALRRRGFKLEYFLRPPVQVTLKFGFQVELCRVDVELWPWGMDRGQACKRLEISTSSDPLPSQNPQQRGHAFKCQSNTESSNTVTEFKLVGRCELREETQVCFTRSNISPRPPFLSTPPPPAANCRQEELWSRGPLSLGAVTQLRVTVPFGGAASALGLKALAVWGQPARCCPAEEVERIKRVHEASDRRLPRPVFFAPSVSQSKSPLQAATPPSKLSIPEEFLDPITQEVMMLPMLLPSGVSVDNTTMEEHQKREATWGRTPNDPFTGVPFTSTSQPLPNPQLKSRIDLFLLQQGMMSRDGMLGRQGDGENPQASRLIASEVHGQSQYSPCLSESTKNNTAIQYNAVPSCSSHEQRLSASLDEALFSALQGRPSFTSNLSQQSRVIPDSEPLNTSQHSLTAGTPNMPTGEKTCSACSCSVSAYSKSAPSIYRLTCGHLLCHACLRRESQPLDTVTITTSNHIVCPACQSTTPRSDVIRVHH